MSGYLINVNISNWQSKIKAKNFKCKRLTFASDCIMQKFLFVTGIGKDFEKKCIRGYN